MTQTTSTADFWGTRTEPGGFAAFCSCGWLMQGWKRHDLADKALIEHRQKVHPASVRLSG